MQEALPLLESAAKNNLSENGRVFSALGATYERLGKYPKAELALRKALAFEDDDSAVRANLALVLVKLERPAQAIELFADLDEESLKDVHPLGLVAQGMAQQKLGKYDEAEQHLMDALKLQPKKPHGPYCTL